jgi:branched-chain amino acid transport system substrate-binding protein
MLKTSLSTARRLVATALVALTVASLAACPSGRRRIAPPEPPIPQDGDVRARQRFQESQSTFRQAGEGNGSAEITAAFESIAREFPDDPIVPHALLYAGMSAVRAGDYAAALESLNRLAENVDADPRLVERGRLFRGLAKNYSGDHAGAIADLRAGDGAIDREQGGELVEWLAAMAIAHRETGQIAQAMPHFDAWYERARESERAFIEAQIRSAIDQLAEGDVVAAYNGLATREGPAAALLGLRLAALYSSRGQTDRAADIRSETARAREKMGLVAARPAGSREGNPSRVGGLMPLSGARNRLGDRTGSGLALASSFGGRSGSGARAGWPRRFELVMRDSGSEAARAVAGLEELDAGDVVAVVGPVDRQATAEAAAAAARLGLPLVSLSQVPPPSESPYVFHAVHSAAQRAEALARHAVDKGVKDFAIFHPRNGYGTHVSAAFAAEVRRLGGKVIATESYPANATSVNKHIGRGLKRPYQALFVPDSANRLALVAPALATEYLTPRPLGEKAERGRGRSILLLSTAEGLDDNFLRQAGRHAWGAVFAPGFYADVRDPRISQFVSRYQASFRRPPTAFDAYAFDAALAVRAAVEDGATDRVSVADALTALDVEGVTGRIRFGGDRRRADAGVLFAVELLPESSSYIIQAIR